MASVLIPINASLLLTARTSWKNRVKWRNCNSGVSQGAFLPT